MSNNDAAKDIANAFNGIASGVKIASRKRELKELMENGYLAFHKNAAAELYMNEHKEEGYTLSRINGDYRIFPPDDDITSIKSYINDPALANMCGLVKIFKDYQPLSIIFSMSDDNLSYSLVSYDNKNNSTIVLGHDVVSYSTEFQIKALPTILIDLKNYNDTFVVLEDEEKFNLMDAPDKTKSYAIFKGFNYEQQKTIYEVKNFANNFVNDNRSQTKDKLEDVIFTGEEKNASSDELDKKNAQIIIDGFMHYASQVEGPLFVSIVKDTDGNGKYKLGSIDAKNKKIVTLTERPINYYGEFRKTVLPFLNRELQARGRYKRRPMYGKLDENVVTNLENFGDYSILLFNGFTEAEIVYTNEMLKKSEENKNIDSEMPKEFFIKYADYNKMMMDKVSKNGYLCLSKQEFIEFSTKFSHNDWDTTLRGDKVYIYPPIKTLMQSDKSINTNIFTAVRTGIQENNGTISVLVDRLEDGSCKVEVNRYDNDTNSLVNLATVRVMFEGDFLQNILPFLYNSLPILGPVTYKEFSLFNLDLELPIGMLKNKNVVMFRGLTPEMSRQLHNVIEFGQGPDFGIRK